MNKFIKKNQLLFISLLGASIIIGLGFFIFFALGYSTNNCKNAKTEIALNTKIFNKSDKNLFVIAEGNGEIVKDYLYYAKGYNYDKCEVYTSTKLNFYYNLNNQTQLIYTSDATLSKIINSDKNLNINLTEELQELINVLLVNTFDSNTILISGLDIIRTYSLSNLNQDRIEVLIASGAEKKWYQLNIHSNKNLQELNKILKIGDGNNDFIADYGDKANGVLNVQDLKCEGGKCTMNANIRITTGSDRKTIYKKAAIDLSLENQEVIVTGGKEIN
jgi:hypothetical protein